MKNKRGLSGIWLWILIGVGVLVLIGIGGGFSSLAPDKGFAEYMQQPSAGFEEVLPFGDEVIDGFKFLNYIFGEVPLVLIELTSDFSAAIIVIGVWFLFLLTFGDIMQLFGMFSKNVGWLVALILTIIIANVQLIKVLAVFFLTITAAFGALSVLVSIGGIFVIFTLFHLGIGDWRRKAILRKAEDSALRSVAGGKKIASGASVLADVAKAAGEA